MTADRTAFGVTAWIMAASMGLTLAPSALQAQTWSTMQFSRQLQTEREISVRVRYGAGQVFLSGADARHLYQARLRFDEEGVEPVHEYADGRLLIGVDGTGRRSPFRRGEGEGELELRLTRNLPMDLTMELGAVRAELDLGGLQLRSMQLTTGASDTEIRVSQRNPIEMERLKLEVGAAAFRARELGNLNARQIHLDVGVGDVRLDMEHLRRAETEVKVSMGLGSVEIRVPRGVGVELSRSTFLASVNAPGMTRSGDVWVSPEWGRAERQLRIQVDAALGSISVIRFDPE